MCPSLIESTNEETDTKWTLRRMSCLDLTLLTNGCDQSLTRMLASIDILILEASVGHELAQEASISCHTCDDDSHVLVDLEDLFLVDCQVMRRLLQTQEDDMSG